MWKEITQPTKFYTGTSGTVHIPIGCVLLQVQAVGAGTITGIPDGQGGSTIITIPTGTQWFVFQPQHVNIKFDAPNDATTGTVWDVVFTGTTSYLIEVMNPGGGF